ncbi:MAG: cytochrome c family protein [Pyrinomonadaceae bacterium MAG19_C2-C3]|nr:cytochrome c family protein [Pyrinomonadaceae bacterium MAG19_C2-C3]
MPQIFHRSTNALSKLSIVVGALLAVGAIFTLLVLDRSNYNTGAFVDVQQPVQFSHKHHNGDIGIDCRYCHTAVEVSSSAGIPPTATCMNCHTQIWADSPYLEPVRESWRTRQPIQWVRVHDLPDFVYFNHSVHVAKGVGCSTCHGNMIQQPLVHQVASLKMEWCLECHRQPELFLRPKDQIYNAEWQPPSNQEEVGLRLKKQYNVMTAEVLTSCSTCHR